MAKTRKYMSQDPLSAEVVVLRKIDTRKFPGTYEFLGDEIIHHAGTENSIRARDTFWYDDGYFLNDLPRESNASNELIKATTGFAVARTDTGRIMAEFPADGLKAAEKAAKGATVQLNVDISLEDDEPDAEFLASLPSPVAEEALTEF